MGSSRFGKKGKSISGKKGLQALNLSNASLLETAAQGAVVGNILNRTQGSTLSLTNSAGNRFAISGTQIVRGVTALDYETATSHSITIRETLRGVTRDTVKVISVTDVAEGTDTTPNAFSFTNLNNQALSTQVTGSPTTITGINAPASFTVTGGSVQVNGTGSFVTSGTVSNNQTLTPRLTTSGSNSTAVSMTVTVGGVAATFTATTTSGVTTLTPQFVGVNFPHGAHAVPNEADWKFVNEGGVGSFYHDTILDTANADVRWAGLPNMNIVRVAFWWERIQLTLGAALDSTVLARLTTEVNLTTARGGVALLDVHNYASRPQASSFLIGGTGPTAAQYNDLWTRLANAFKTNPLVWFGLMNEPIGFPGGAAEWAGYATGAKNAIRATGATNKILVPGIGYTGAHSWVGLGNDTAYVGWSDSNYAFEVHQYADFDFSGTHRGSLVSETVYSDNMAEVTTWARTNGHKLFLGEFNTDREGANERPGERCLADCMKFMRDNADVWLGCSVWQGGPLADNQEYTIVTDDDGTAPSRHDRVMRAIMVTGSTVATASNTAAGVITGTAQEGQTLTSGTGTWSASGNADLGFQVFFQWQVSDNGTSGWTNISGATNATLILAAQHIGKYIRCGRYAKNIGGSSATVYTPATAQVIVGTPAELTEVQPFEGWFTSGFNVGGSIAAPFYIEGTPNGSNGIFILSEQTSVVTGVDYKFIFKAQPNAANMLFAVQCFDPALGNNDWIQTTVNLTTGTFTNAGGGGSSAPMRTDTTTVTSVGGFQVISQTFRFASAGTPRFGVGITANSPAGRVTVPTTDAMSFKTTTVSGGGGGGTLGPELLTNTMPGGTGWTTSPFNVGGSSVSSGSFSGSPDGFSGILSTLQQTTVDNTSVYELSSQAGASASGMVYRIGVDDPSGASNYQHIFVNMTTNSYSLVAAGGSQPAVVGIPTVTTVGSEKLIKIRLTFATAGTPNFVVGMAESSAAGTVTLNSGLGLSFKKVT